jgi:hypothetical protein
MSTRHAELRAQCFEHAGKLAQRGFPDFILKKAIEPVPIPHNTEAGTLPTPEM